MSNESLQLEPADTQPVERRAPPALEYEPSEDALTARERAVLRRTRGTRLPLLFVLVSLGLALLVPLLAQRRIDQLRREISEVADPARTRVAEIRLDVALEAAARRAYRLTGDPQLAKDIAESRSRRREAQRQLEGLAPRLGEPIAGQIDRLTDRLDSLDTRLDSEVIVNTKQAPPAAELESRRRALSATMDDGSRLRAAVVAATDRLRDRIQRIERAVGVITGVLVLLGLIAATLVARLGSGYRRLALRLEESEARYRQIAEAAERRRVALEQVTESRTRLIRGFTHDVKNPLGSVDGFLALLEEGADGELTDRQRTWVSRSRRAIKHALELIKQLLDIARAEAGELEIHARDSDVVEIAEEVTDAFRAQAEAKGLSLRSDIPAELPHLRTDPSRVRQVVGNLVSNAVKYTPAGGTIGVRVDARADGTGSAARWLAVEVADTGEGIPAENLERLFLEFTRFDPEAAEGTGIGLAISQRIAHALGGEITVRSRVGEGSTFTLLLPLALS